VEPDFRVRHGLDAPGLIELFAWEEAEFLRHTEGSAIRRIGHERWLRNIAVALGNAPKSPAVVAALRARLAHPSELVREHVVWALAERMDQSGKWATVAVSDNDGKPTQNAGNGSGAGSLNPRR
jgi:epoxyqueuosine reductase